MFDKKDNKLAEGDILISSYDGRKVTIIKVEDNQILLHSESPYIEDYWLSQSDLLRSAWLKEGMVVK